MTNEIGLTWEELKDAVGVAYFCENSSFSKAERLLQIRLWMEKKSGPINIVEDDEVCEKGSCECNPFQKEDFLIYEHPGYFNGDLVKCGKLATHDTCSPLPGVTERLLCPEHAKLYEGAEEL